MIWRLAVALLALAIAAVAAPYTINVFATIGPEYDYSAAYPAWNDTVVQQLFLAGGSSSVPGIGGSPTGYTNLTGGTITHADMTRSVDPGSLTGFYSWRGVEQGIGGTFGGQYGNALYFPWSIVAATGTISLSQVSVQVTSPELVGVPGYGDFNNSYDYTGYNYSSDFRGWNGPGTDTIAGTPDDLWVTSGAGTQQVLRIFYSGPAFTFNLDPDFPGGTDSQWMEYTLLSAATLGDFETTVCVSAGTDSNCGSITATAIPEPGTWALLGVGLALIALRRKAH